MTMVPPPGAPWPMIGHQPTGGQEALDLGSSVHQRLFEQRVVLVSGTLDVTMANRVCAELMTLDATGDEPVEVHVDSREGTLDAALSVIDVIDLLGVEVRTTCMGQALGPALGVLAAGRVRRASPHARLRMAEPPVEVSGSPQDLKTWVGFHHDQLRRFARRLAEATRQPIEQILSDIDAGCFLDAEGALHYGLIDEILRPDAAVLPLPRPFGFRPRG